MRKRAPEAAAGQADEDGLQGVGVELQDVESGEREDRPRGERSRDPADPGDDHVLEQGGAAAVGAGEADGEDRDRDRRLHHLAHLQARVGRGHREDDAEEEAPAHRADRGLRHRGRGGDDGPVRLAGGERQVGVRGEGSGVGSVHSASGARARRASLFASRRLFKCEVVLMAVAIGSAAGAARPRSGTAARTGDPKGLSAAARRYPWSSAAAWPGVAVAIGSAAGALMRPDLARVTGIVACSRQAWNGATQGWLARSSGSSPSWRRGPPARRTTRPRGAWSRRWCVATRRRRSRSCAREPTPTRPTARAGPACTRPRTGATSRSPGPSSRRGPARTCARARGGRRSTSPRGAGAWSWRGCCGSTARRARASRSATRCASGPGAATATAAWSRPPTRSATASASRGSWAARAGCEPEPSCSGGRVVGTGGLGAGDVLWVPASCLTHTGVR